MSARPAFPFLCVASALLVAWPASADPPPPRMEVPYGRRGEIAVAPAPEETVLHVRAYFHSPTRRFGRREAALTVNGQLLTANSLLGARSPLQPRTPEGRFDRLDGARPAVWFPWTHREGGLGDFDPMRDPHHYQSHGGEFRCFDESIFIDLKTFPPDPEGRYTLTFYNSAAGPIGPPDKAGHPSGPALVVLLAQTVREVPVIGPCPFVPPIWPVLNADTQQAGEAQRRMDDSETPPAMRSRIAFQFGLREMIAGDRAAGTDRFRQALAWSDAFPERNETVFHLATLDPDSAPDSLDANNDPFGWARLFNVRQQARRGENDFAILDVHPIEDGPVGDAERAASLRQGADARPVARPVPGIGQAPPADNTVAFRYSSKALFLAFRGPGTEWLRPNHIPGADRPVWEHNCVELFLCPGADMFEYFELNVSSVNARFDGRHRYHRICDSGWNGEWQSAARIRDGVMEIEMRIPWSDLGRGQGPVPGESWAANVIRVQHLPDGRGGWSGAELSLGPLAARDFHRMQDGVILRFR